MPTPNQEKLTYWIREREAIRQMKAIGTSKPWSDDPIFQETYFTNVDREDDKTTEWIRQNWNYRFGSPGIHGLAMITARLFNNIGTLEEIGYPADKNLDEWLWCVEDILELRQERGDKIWSGAYIVSTEGKKISKLRYCINLIENLLPLSISNLEEIEKMETLEQVHKALIKVEGLDSFLAAQVVADLKNSSSYPLNSAPDWHTFSAHGPGSLRGLSWFWGTKVTPKTYQEAISKANDILQWELEDEILDKLCM